MFTCQIKVRMFPENVFVSPSIETVHRNDKTFHRNLIQKNKNSNCSVQKRKSHWKEIKKMSWKMFSLYLELCASYNLLIFHRLLKEFYFLIMHVCFLTSLYFCETTKKNFNQKIIFQARFDGETSWGISHAPTCVRADSGWLLYRFLSCSLSTEGFLIFICVSLKKAKQHGQLK